MNQWLYFTGRNVPSSKNNKKWTGKILIKNKLSLDYEKWSAPLFLQNKRKWKQQMTEYPVNVEFYFYRDSKRRFDYINCLQIIADLMQFHGYIEDDDADHFIPIFSGYEVTDKEHSGFRMRINNIT